jgi:pSer/pThr/pTyr-binding forkhead associated (FHA) protein
MPKLIVTLADGTDVAHELTEEVVTIGRLSDNTIQIDDASVSSHHAQITVSGGEHILKDLDSTNGTRINDVVFSEGPIHEGEHIRFGKISARFTSDDPNEARPLPEQQALAAAVAESSARPEDFGNASPFKTKTKKKDPIATGIMAGAGVAILALIAAAVYISQLGG